MEAVWTLPELLVPRAHPSLRVQVTPEDGGDALPCLFRLEYDSGFRNEVMLRCFDWMSPKSYSPIYATHPTRKRRHLAVSVLPSVVGADLLSCCLYLSRPDYPFAPTKSRMLFVRHTRIY